MPPDELVDAGCVVHQSADVVGGDDTAYPDHAGVGVDGDLGEDGSERVSSYSAVVPSGWFRGPGGFYGLDRRCG